MSERELELLALARARPRSRFLRLSFLFMAAFAAYSWTSGEFALADIFSERRLANLERFLHEVRPFPLQGRPFDLGEAWAWAIVLLSEKGWQAAVTTLALSVAAIVLAGAGAALLALPATRTFASAEPFLPAARKPTIAGRATATSVVWATRALLIFLRAVPEYVWAFLFVTMIGFGPWAAVLALAVHNTGILGKLTAETVENLETSAPAALRGLGAGRGQIAMVALFPAVLPRFLLYFFYRWETCVREATVLGMLGILSLGSVIRDARAANFYDEMVFFVLLGAGLVLIGDLVSAAARTTLRHSG